MWLKSGPQRGSMALTCSLAAATLTIALQVLSLAIADTAINRHQRLTRIGAHLAQVRSSNNNGTDESHQQKQYSPTSSPSKMPPNKFMVKILLLSRRDASAAQQAAAAESGGADQSNSNSNSNSTTSGFEPEALSVISTLVDQQQENEINTSYSKINAITSENANANASEEEALSGDKVLDVNLIQAVEYGLFRHSLSVSVILTIAYTMVFVIGIVGNSFVVAIVCKSPRMRTVTNYFIANLALADILVLLLCLPATLASNLFIPYVLGLFVCKTVSYLQGVAVSASINTMVAVTMDRFLAICFPMDWHMSRRMARWTIACIWLFSLAISLPWALYFTIQPANYSPSYTFNYCTEAWPNDRIGIIYFVCANLILLYLFPATVILLCYLGIWYKIERRNIPGDRPKGLRIELIMQKSKLKVVKMMMVVVVIFLLSWLPLYLISARVKLAQDQNSIEDWILNLMPLAQWLGSSNSCINPILYTFFNSKYKREFIDMLRAGFCCKPLPTSESKQRIAANGLMTTTTNNGPTTVNSAATLHSNGCNGSKLPRSRAAGGCGAAGIRRSPAAGGAAAAIAKKPGSVVTTTYIRMDNLRRDSQQARANSANRNRPRGSSTETLPPSSKSKLFEKELELCSEADGCNSIGCDHLLGKRKRSEDSQIKGAPGEASRRPTARRWLSAGARLTAATAAAKKRRKLYQKVSRHQGEGAQEEARAELQRNENEIGISRPRNKLLRLTNSANRTRSADTCSGDLCPLASSGVHRQAGGRRRSLATTETDSRRKLCCYHQQQVQALKAASGVTSGSQRHEESCGAATGRGKKSKKTKGKKGKKDGVGFIDRASGIGERSVKSNSTNTTRDTESTDITGLSFTTNATSANQDLAIRNSDGALEEVEQYKSSTEMAGSITCPSRLPTLAAGGDEASHPPTTSGGSASGYSYSSASRDVEEGDDLYIDGLDGEILYDYGYDNEEGGCYYENEEYHDDDDDDQMQAGLSELDDEEGDDEDEDVDEEDDDDDNLLFGSAHVSQSSSETPSRSRLPWKQRPRSSLDSRRAEDKILAGSCMATKRSTLSLAIRPATALSLAKRLGLISGPERETSDRGSSTNNEEGQDNSTYSPDATQSKFTSASSNGYETPLRTSTHPVSPHTNRSSPCRVDHTDRLVQRPSSSDMLMNQERLVSDNERDLSKRGSENERESLGARNSRDSGQISGVECELLEQKKGLPGGNNEVRSLNLLQNSATAVPSHSVVIHSNPIIN